MRKFVVSLLAICVCLASKGQNQQQLLLKAYQTGSSLALTTFFDNWARATPPITPLAFQQLNDTLKAVYDVFATFYTPLETDRVGGSEWGSNMYKNVKFVLLQDRISYRVTGTLNDSTDLYGKGYPDSCERTVVFHFRPRLTFLSPAPVILTPFYDSLLNAFLGNTYHKLGEKHLMTPAYSKGESARRQAFLERLIRIFYGHWGGYWQLYSYPVVNCITFDKTFTHAKLTYRMVYEGGEATLEKVSGKWKLTEAKRTWIE